MKKPFLTLAALLLACLGLTVPVGTAAAHTPAISADCSGVQLTATSYDADQANTWTVTIGGATQSGTFGASFSQTFPVPQAGATTAWSARIASEDGAFDSGVRSGNVGPCGEVDECTDLPGNQPPGTECTPPPTVVRTEAGKQEGCEVAFQGREYGAGELTYDTVFEDGFVFNPDTNVWDLVTDTTGEVRNVEFTAWTRAEQVEADCIEEEGDGPDDGGTDDGDNGNPGDDGDSGSSGNNGETGGQVAGTDASTTPAATTTQAASSAIPTVIDAGLVGAIGAEGSATSEAPSFASLAGLVAGAGLLLILGAAFAPRRRITR